MFVRLLVYPFAYCIEHVAVDFDRFVAQSGVVEGAQDVGHYFVHGNAWVLPGVDYAGGYVL
jgi:hypothetical protein